MMKALYKKIGILTTLGYCFGILLVAYLLISIPQDLKNLSFGLPNNVLDQLNPLFNKLNISIAVVLFLGMTSLILLLFNDKSASVSEKNYVAEKIKDSQIRSEEDTEHYAENEKILQTTDQILSEKGELKAISNKLLSAVCKEFEACQGAVYNASIDGEKRTIELISSYAYPIADSQKIEFEFGEGLVGQAAKEGKILNIDSVPDGYIKILSGLGSSSPTNLIIIPFITDQIVRGVVEIASFKKFKKRDEETLNKIFSRLAPKFVASVPEPPVKKKTTIVQ